MTQRYYASDIEESELGNYVLYTEYQQLEQQIELLQQMLIACDCDGHGYGFGNGMYYGD